MHHRPRHRRHLIESLEPRQLLSTVTVSSATASESAGALAFHVSLDAPASRDVTLNYMTTPDNDVSAATPNKDYLPARGKLTIPAGQTEADITVTLKNDSLYETTEALRLNLTATGGAKLAKTSVKGTITDDDAAPSLTFKDVTTKEGNAGQHAVTLTVSLSKPAGSPLTFKYTTSDDTPHFLAATAGSDYVAATGTITFLPGQTKKTIRVFVKGDTTSESDEAFRVTLSYQGNDVAAAAVTIKNDDKPAKTDAPLLSLSDATALEGDSGTSLAAVTVTLSKPTDHDVTFRYSYPGPMTRNAASKPLTATSLDYVPASGTLTIPAGQTSATIPVTLVGDTTYEGNQTFEVRLSNVKNARPINGRPDVSSAFHVIDDEPVLYADADGNYVSAPSGLARPSDQLVSYYDTGSLVVPVLYSQSHLIAPASAVGGVSLAPRFPESSVVALAPNVYTMVGSAAVTNYAASSLTIASAGTLKVNSGTLAVNAASSSASLGAVMYTAQVRSADYLLADVYHAQISSVSGQILAGGQAQFGSVATSNLSYSGGVAYTGSTSVSGAMLTVSGSNAYGGYTSDSGPTSLLVKLTLAGDANLDGKVNADDYALLDRHLAVGTPGTWLSGDFNYDGSVTSADYLLMDTTFAHQGNFLSPEFLAEREKQFGADYVTQLVAAIQPPSDGSDATPPVTTPTADATPNPDAASSDIALADPPTPPSSAGPFNSDTLITPADPAV